MPEVRPIDANALFNDLKASVKAAREWKEGTQDEEIKIRAEQAHGTFIECALRVKNAPTIEAEPVRHGRWNYRHDDDWCYCTACGADAEGDCGEPLETLYCPNCGAKMEGGAENG